MHDSGPYQTPNDSSKPFDAKLKPRSRMRWAMIGLALGAAVPVAFGFYSFHQQSIYYASLAPNEGACGMGTLGALAMILLIGPFCGMIGAGSGWIASGIDWWAAL